MADPHLQDRLSITNFAHLMSRSSNEIQRSLNGKSYRARVAFPNYHQNILEHYHEFISNGLQVTCEQAAFPFGLPKFGLVIDFQSRP